MIDSIKMQGEWYFEYDDLRVGPFSNSFLPEGLAKIAELLQGVSSPYLVVGDDTEPGYAITEVFRKPVSAVTRDGPLVRFRTQLLMNECNGDHQKTCIYIETADNPGTGTMLNMLTQPWSKSDNTTLTVECRITMQGVS